MTPVQKEIEEVKTALTAVKLLTSKPDFPPRYREAISAVVDHGLEALSSIKRRTSLTK